ncbi:MAG TPA: acetate--CoA ligase [Planctomycetota bacterium]|nr:acetate--CoA ligase [Planctomycetota bacterium]
MAVPMVAGEVEVYEPPAGLAEQCAIPNYEEVYRHSVEDPEGFWDGVARGFEWYEPWQKVLDWQYPFAKWFVGAKCNIVQNALDRHLSTWRRNKAALLWEGEPGETRSYTYFQLSREVCRFANVLKSMGVRKGDRVTVYLPRVPEQVIAMLACAKIGAIHSVVYGGFSHEALRTRIEDAEARVLITADGGYYNGKIVQLKAIADQATAHAPSVEIVIVVRRTGSQVHMEPARDVWYHELMSLPIASAECATERLDADDPLFVLYTSGTTGQPKGILHVHGGYMVGVGATTKWVFDLRDEDTYWCTADAGWVTGHSYIVYGPLINGATVLLYEGAPTAPRPDRWWSLVERYGVSVLYTTPTAIRGLMRFGESWVARRDLSTLRLLGTVGEPINPEAWRWYYNNVGRKRCPIMDTWWQTETGMIMISPVPSTPLKPGSATLPLPGVVVDVVDEHGSPVPADHDGFLVIRRPWPAMLRTLYKDPDRYRENYWEKIPNVYTAGDSARKDKDGYIWVIGRIDDVLKVSGYRLGTAEVESALVSHAAVSEAAAIGKPHDLKGNAIKVFVVLKSGYQATDKLKDELRVHVGKELGPIARPDEIDFVDALPKTRSGKIMRRLLRARELGLPEGDVSTLED